MQVIRRFSLTIGGWTNQLDQLCVQSGQGSEHTNTV